MAIRSACYLQGNKYLLWDTIKPHLKCGDRKVLIDAFFGSGTVSLNASNENSFEHIIGNDSATWQIDLHKAILDPEFIFKAKRVNDLYPETEEGFDSMKVDYNKDITQMDYLYNLMCRGNSNMTRFSGQGDKRKYNMSYGKRARYSTERLMRNLVLLKDVDLHNTTFGIFFNKLEGLLKKREYAADQVTLYIDSPYYNSVATYNENGGWTVQDDEILMRKMVELHDAGYHIVSSNAFHNRGKTNQRLIDWVKENEDRFTVHYLNRDYSNSSYFKSDDPTVEVLIVSK